MIACGRLARAGQKSIRFGGHVDDGHFTRLNQPGDKFPADDVRAESIAQGADEDLMHITQSLGRLRSQSKRKDQ
jgi:hypothetical protein